MEKVIPRNDPSSESMTQDNVVKQPFQMGVPENLAGNESGPTNLIPPTTEVFAAPTYINIEASGENRSAQFKNPQAKQDVPPGAAGQYQ